MAQSRDPSRLRMIRSESASNSRSRPTSRARTQGVHILDVETLMNPDALVSEDVVELLQEFVHPHHESETTLGGPDPDQSSDGGDGGPDLEWHQDLPWWKKPSPRWYVAERGTSKCRA